MTPRAALLALAVLVCPLARAADSSTISGSVYDAVGVLAPYTSLTLTDQRNGMWRRVTAGQDGKYIASNLPAGSYSVVATSVQAGVHSVTVVVGDGQIVDLSIFLSGDLSAGLDRKDSPLSGRSDLDLIRDVAEITPGQPGGDIEGYGPYGFRGNTSLNVSGIRGQDNGFLLDGMDNNQRWTRGQILEMPPEAVASVTLAAGYIPATLGHAQGAAVSETVRSGSNAFHGSLFEYLRNAAPDGRNFFDGGRKPGLVSNQFGGSLGGPVRKNDWFFFGDFELLRASQGLTVISTVPTAAQRAGNFGSTPIYDPLTIYQTTPNFYLRQPFLNNRIQPSRVSLPSQRLLALYPFADLPGAADNYRFNPSSIRNRDRFDLRSDKRISSRSALFGRVSYQRFSDQSPGAFPAPSGLAVPSATVGSDITQGANGGTSRSSAWGGAISDSFTATPSLINQFRAGSAAIDLSSAANDAGANASALLGIPGLGNAGLPSVMPTGFSSLGSAEPMPLHVRTSNYEAEDDVAWTTHRHAWKFGVQMIRNFADGTASDVSDRGVFRFTPDYTSIPGSPAPTGDSMASLLLGFPSEVREDVQFAPFQLRSWEWSGFAQDQVRIGKRLTLQAGVRYSFLPPPTEANNRMVNFSFTTQNPALNQFASQGGISRYAEVNFNKHALAPRVGFAFDVFGEGSTVLRGGFSQDYDAGSFIAQGSLARNAPYAYQLDRINGTFQLGPNLASGIPAPVAVALDTASALAAGQQGVNAIQPDHFTPYADQWDLFLQRRLRSRLRMEIGGTGSMGAHLLAVYNTNQPYPAPTPYATQRYPFQPYFGRVNYLNNGAGSTYYGGVVKLTGEVISGLRIEMSYAYAKSEDDGVAPFTDPEGRPSGLQYIYYPRGDRSPSPFDITQRMVLLAHYDVPFKRSSAGAAAIARLASNTLAGWGLSSLVTVQTGFPLTPELATNSLNNGGFQLPDRAASGALPPDQRSYLHWFDTSLGPAGAFREPLTYQYGNSGFGIIRGPGLANVDAALHRTFVLRERLLLGFRMEASNLLNHANLALPDRFLGVESSGVISHTVTPARQFQVALRMTW